MAKSTRDVHVKRHVRGHAVATGAGLVAYALVASTTILVTGDVSSTHSARVCDFSYIASYLNCHS